MLNFPITTKNGIKLVTGHKINKDFFCHKSESTNQWVVTDARSGLLVEKGFKKGTDCFDWVKTSDLSILEQKRSTPRYAEICKKIQEWKEANL